MHIGENGCQRHPKTLTVEETHCFLDKLLVKEGTEKQFRRGIRNYTIAILILETGLRIGEALSLQWLSIFWDSRPVTSIVITAEIAKTSVSREIPISSRLYDALIEYKKYYEPLDCDITYAYLFQGWDCRDKMTSRTVERIFERIGLKAIGKPVWPHLLRHTFATRLMKLTDIRTVQVLLGHTHLSSTQIYTHPGLDDLKSAIESLNN